MTPKVLNARTHGHAAGTVSLTTLMLRAVRAGWARLAGAYERHQHRLGIESILSLDDAQLRDIGVCRADVEWALRHHGALTPGEALARISGRRQQANRRLHRPGRA